MTKELEGQSEQMVLKINWSSNETKLFKSKLDDIVKKRYENGNSSGFWKKLKVFTQIKGVGLPVNGITVVKPSSRINPRSNL